MTIPDPDSALADLATWTTELRSAIESEQRRRDIVPESSRAEIDANFRNAVTAYLNALRADAVGLAAYRVAPPPPRPEPFRPIRWILGLNDELVAIVNVVEGRAGPL